MKIAILHPHLTSFGGGEKLVLDYLEYFSKNHDITIFTSKYVPNETYKEFEKYKKKMFVPDSNNYLLNLISWLRLDLSSFDVAISCGFPTYFSSWRNKNIVYKVMAPPEIARSMKYTFLQPIDKFFVRKCKKLIVDSTNMKDFYKKYSGNSNIKMLIPGVTQSFVVPNPRKSYAVYIGRISREKGLDKFVERWPVMNKFFYNLLIVGGGNPPYVNLLKEKIKGKSIQLVGPKPHEEAMKLLEKSNMLVLPAFSEPFGLVIQEALSHSKPAVCLNSGGPKDLISNNIDGFLCVDYNEMIEKIKLLSENTKMRKIFSQNAYTKSMGWNMNNYLQRFENELLTETNS